jgi:hypothetical protein
LHLSSLTRLTELNLKECTGLTSVVCAALPPRLRSLNLWGLRRIDEAGLNELRCADELDELQGLHLLVKDFGRLCPALQQLASMAHKN